LTHENIQIAFDFNVHGTFAAVQAVLPDMQARRSGTVLFTTGASSVYPHMANDIFEIFANFAITGAALRAYSHAFTRRSVRAAYRSDTLRLARGSESSLEPLRRRSLRCTGNSTQSEKKWRRSFFMRQPMSRRTIRP
jgi:NAD(P)-dependent dehydrogenase (short-subunit alcohol dehydrogenase family)